VKLVPNVGDDEVTILYMLNKKPIYMSKDGKLYRLPPRYVQEVLS
jgi:hypothetical protein